MKEITIFNGYKLYVDETDMGISRDLAIHGIRESTATKYFQSILKPGMVVYDIGSNIGYYVLVAHEKIESEGFIYSFEPLQSNVELLKMNTAANGITNIEIYPIALGDMHTQEILSISKLSNLNAIVKEEDISELGLKWFDKHIIGKTEVEQWDLDGFIEYNKLPIPDVLRMDVEGYEIRVLKGADTTLEKMATGSILFIEFHGDLIRDKKQVITKLHSELIEKDFFVTWGQGINPNGKETFLNNYLFDSFINFAINNNFVHIFYIKH